MLTVALLAYSPLKTALSAVLMQQPDIYLALSTDNIREVLAYDFSVADVLVVDDAVLLDNLGASGNVSQLSCHKVLIGNTDDFACTRRAIALQAVDVIDERTATAELLTTLRPYHPVESIDTPRMVIGVYSPKGGVGKTTVALNLAWAMAEISQYSVALVDLDMFGDIGAMLVERPPITVVDMIQGLEGGMAPEKALQSLYVAKESGLTIVPSSVNPQQSAQIQPAHIDLLINLLRTNHAYIIMDLPTGLTEHNLVALDAADKIVVVTLPENVTLRAVARSMEVLGKLYGDKVSVALNRADSGTGMDVDDVTRIIGYDVQYALPSGGTGPVKASNQGRPLVVADPKNSFAVEIVRIANQLISAYEGSRRARKKAPFSAVKS